MRIKLEELVALAQQPKSDDEEPTQHTPSAIEEFVAELNLVPGNDAIPYSLLLDYLHTKVLNRLDNVYLAQCLARTLEKSQHKGRTWYLVDESVMAMRTNEMQKAIIESMYGKKKTRKTKKKK